jgi:hypothetical protein
MRRPCIRHLRSGFALLLGLLGASCAEPTATSASEAPRLSISVAPRGARSRSFRSMPDTMLWRRIEEAGGVAAIGLKAPGQSSGMSARGRVLVSPPEWARAIGVVSAVRGVAVVRRDTLRPFIRARLANPAAVTALRALPHVDYVEPAIIVAENLWASGCGDDAYVGNEYRYLPSGDVMPNHFAYMRIDRAWAYATGAGVIIGLTDTGIDPGQPELRENFASGESAGRWVRHRVTNGDLSYACPHGTHMAGTMAAPKNGILNVGVAWRANLVSEYQADRVWWVNHIDAQQAIDDAGQQGATVISMAWQVDPDDGYLTITNAIKWWHYNYDVLFVGAAGTGDCWKPFINEGNVMFPAWLDEVLAVSAAGLDGNRPCDAAYGPELDVVAYQEMPTTPMGGHTYLENTSKSSSATAIVTGIAALVRERYKTWTAPMVFQRIRTTAGIACGPRGWADIVNAEAAVGGLCVYGGGISGTDLIAFMDQGPDAEQSRSATFHVTVSGGSGNYHILWPYGQTGPSATITFARGTYQHNVEVTITDLGHGTAPLVLRKLVHVIDECAQVGGSCECDGRQEECGGGGDDPPPPPPPPPDTTPTCDEPPCDGGGDSQAAPAQPVIMSAPTLARGRVPMTGPPRSRSLLIRSLVRAFPDHGSATRSSRTPEGRAAAVASTHTRPTMHDSISAAIPVRRP